VCGYAELWSEAMDESLIHNSIQKCGDHAT
jgi:hypothetical protein